MKLMNLLKIKPLGKSFIKEAQPTYNRVQRESVFSDEDLTKKEELGNKLNPIDYADMLWKSVGHNPENTDNMEELIKIYELNEADVLAIEDELNTFKKDLDGRLRYNPDFLSNS